MKHFPSLSVIALGFCTGNPEGAFRRVFGVGKRWVLLALALLMIRLAPPDELVVVEEEGFVLFSTAQTCKAR